MKAALCGGRLRRAAAIVTGALVGAWSTNALADGAASRRDSGEENIEHTIIVGAGGASELELADRSLHAGANMMVEWDAIENWLELEVGASVLAAEGGFEVPTELLIKKPFRSPRRRSSWSAAGQAFVEVHRDDVGDWIDALPPGQFTHFVFSPWTPADDLIASGNSAIQGVWQQNWGSTHFEGSWWKGPKVPTQP